MYRLVLESLLGLQVEGGRLHVRPVLRPGWTRYEMSYRFRTTNYRIDVQVVAETSQASVSLDGVQQADGITLVDDQLAHEVIVLVPGAA